MRGPRPLLLALAVFCAPIARAAAQTEADALSQTSALRGMAGAPRLLLIGDSHTVGTFGHELDSQLRARYPGWRIETYASCGAAPDWYLPGNPASGHTSTCEGVNTWFRRYSAQDPSRLEDVTAPSPTPLIGALLAAHRDTVIVALGANMANWKTGGIADMDSAVALAGAITASGAACLWIGPPDEVGTMPPGKAKEQVVRLNAALSKALAGSCRFIQSHTEYSGPDGMHYFPAPARAWAVQTASQIQLILGGGGIPAAAAP